MPEPDTTSADITVDEYTNAVGHPVHDGIVELDNNLPVWWLAVLYGTIAFAFGYWTYYHVFDGTPDQLDEYRAEVAEADAARARAEASIVVNEGLLAGLAAAPDQIAAGSSTFRQMCAACHGMQAQGGVGPNLTDRFWIHGGRPMDVYRTVSGGVLAKGMPPWEVNLGRRKVVQVVAYVGTLRNAAVPGKAPEGKPED